MYSTTILHHDNEIEIIESDDLIEQHREAVRAAVTAIVESGWYTREMLRVETVQWTEHDEDTSALYARQYD